VCKSGASVLRDESETDLSCTDYSAMETPRDAPPPSYDMQGAETLAVYVDEIRMRGIQRLNEPTLTCFVVDKEGAALCHEQTTPRLEPVQGDSECLKVGHEMQLPVPGGARAAGCALIFKLRHVKSQGGVAATRCWSYMDLEGVLAGSSAKQLPMYQKPTDVRRKRVKNEGKNSALSLTLRPPGCEPVAPITGAASRAGPASAAGRAGASEAPKPAVKAATRVLSSVEMEDAVERFNAKPKKGIEYLIENGFLANDATAIIMFMLPPSAPGISRHAIGDYLGTRGEKMCF